MLKGQTEINTAFTYDNIKVGKYDKEEDYIKDKTADYNKKEAGRGDSWAKAWKDAYCKLTAMDHGLSTMD